MAELRFNATLTPSFLQDNPVLIVGQLKNLNKIAFSDVRDKLEPFVNEETFQKAISGLHPSPTDTCPLWLNKASVAALPIKCSRHNTPSRSHALSKLVKSFLSGGAQEFVVIVCERRDVLASASAVARVLPLYSGKSSQSTEKRVVTVEFLLTGETSQAGLSDAEVASLCDISQGIRLAAKIVDTPCADMHTNIFLDEIRQIGNALNITPTIIQGEDLNSQGFGEK